MFYLLPHVENHGDDLLYVWNQAPHFHHSRQELNHCFFHKLVIAMEFRQAKPFRSFGLLLGAIHGIFKPISNSILHRAHNVVLGVNLVELVAQEHIFHCYLKRGSHSRIDLVQIMIPRFNHPIICEQLNIVVNLLFFKLLHFLVTVLEVCWSQSIYAFWRILISVSLFDLVVTFMV